MFDKARDAARRQEIEVDSIAARLIREKGVAPWQAIGEALRIIREEKQGGGYGN